MFNNCVINFALRHLPSAKWNNLSRFCAGFSLPTIGSPIQFTHYKKFRLREYATTELPSILIDKFLTFCYPESLCDRDQQIARDRRLYWKNSVTFLVFNTMDEVVGCVQIIHRTDDTRLPVEYASVANANGTERVLNLSDQIPGKSITEIYRCRRSFSLNRFEAINVLLMLYKALWIHIVRTKTAHTCISYDVEKSELRHLYMNKLAFEDSGIRLVFSEIPQQWCLLIKNWEDHEQTYATLGKTQFYIQTWCRRSVKKTTPPYPHCRFKKKH